MSKQVRADYTREFKQEAVRLAQSAASVAAAARSLGIADQTLHNWLRADRAGKLTVGARKRDILAQFLTEAIVLCLTGGVI